MDNAFECYVMYVLFSMYLLDQIFYIIINVLPA